MRDKQRKQSDVIEIKKNMVSMFELKAMELKDKNEIHKYY
jgi:hypothetical protein